MQSLGKIAAKTFFCSWLFKIEIEASRERIPMTLVDRALCSRQRPCKWDYIHIMCSPIYPLIYERDIMLVSLLLLPVKYDVHKNELTPRDCLCHRFARYSPSLYSTILWCKMYCFVIVAYKKCKKAIWATIKNCIVAIYLPPKSQSVLRLKNH